MITVHHLNNSRSQRILWLLEELGQDYEIKRYFRNPETMRAPDNLKQVHALGKSPLVSDGEVTVAESGAIIEYLIGEYGRDTLVPALGSKAHRDYVYWLHFAEGSLMPPLLMRLLFDKIQSSPMPFFVKPIANKLCAKVMTTFIGPEIKSLLTFIDTYLSTRTWFAGEALSGADIQMSFPLEACVAGGIIDASQYPNCYAYVKRIQALPAYLAALEKGGDYDYGPQ